MLWVKAFHIIFVTAWFAGLFNLPRYLVNLAMVPADSHAERERLLLMGRKLHRFSVGLMLMALGLGAVLWVGYGVAWGPGHAWMHAKLTLVAAVVVYQWYARRLLADFEHGRNRRTHRWFRVFNEVAVLMFMAIVVLVVVKPLV